MLMLIGSLIVVYFVYILISRNNDKPSPDPPAMAHVALREIIERAAAEAHKLPGLSASVNIEHSRERPIAEHSYEDLLTTAILNKVIEKCQKEQRVDGNSNVLCDTDSPKAKCTTTEHGFEEEATSYAFCHLECSNDNGASAAGKNKDDRDLMSFMIEERIEDVTTITSDDELRDNNKFRCVPFPEFGIDIIDPPRNSPSPSSSESLDDYPRFKTRRVADHTMDFALSVEFWEDNWLFQKKRISESQSDPVVMLVPSSSADYKALIGDRDAEDTSDLSECSSTRSDEEIEKELLEAINNVIPSTLKTSKCNAEVNQKMPSIKTQLEKEVVACHTNTNIEKIEIVCEKRKKDDKDKTLEVLEEKTVKDEENERKRSEGSSLITTVKEEKAKEKSKNMECDTKTIEIKSSVNDVKKINFENLSEKNDQVEHITEENEEQRESEYTEHYDTAIQRHLDSLMKVDVCSEKSETSDKTKQIAYTQHGKPESEENNLTVKKSEYSEAQIQLSYATIDGNHMTAENDRLSAPPRPGTIAEREHKKWENAPPIKNNPYSEESIRKRCLERQYSRNSDIPNVHYKLTTLNEVNLDALMLPERSEIKRLFERDYYINQSKSASKEQEEWTKLATSSVSSKPNSSLSQWSSDEQQHERQVSHRELEQFEGASLRDSLPRQCCANPRASAQFAINPLLYLESAQTTASAQSRCEDDDDVEQVKNLTANVIEDTTKDQKSEISVELNIETIFEEIEDNCLLESSKIGTETRNLMSTDWNQLFLDDESADLKAEKQIVPRYDNREKLLGNQNNHNLDDDDSGMYSISSRNLKNNNRERWRQLYQVEETDSHGNEQISSIGKKFWTIGGYKYKTFGGIRIRSTQTENVDDFEDKMASEDRFIKALPEFAELEFQTFGGIKKSRRIDGRRIPGYRRIRLRSILSEMFTSSSEKSRNRIKMEKPSNFELCSSRSASFDQLANLNCSESFERFVSFEHLTSSNFEENNWQDEEDIAKTKIFAENAQIRRSKSCANIFRTNFMIKYNNLICKKNKNKNSFSLCSLASEENKVEYASDKIIMNKFLENVSRQRKTCAFNDNNVATRESKTRNHQALERSGSRLQKSISNEKRIRSATKSSRTQEGKNDVKKSKCNKMNVRSMSDITIW